MYKIINKKDKEFPPLLLEINDTPERLFYIGNISRLQDKEMKILCIVGSRKYSNYGKEVTEKLISEIKGYNICIVSGLALGIDSIAHRSAIDNGLYTIAFPGSGLHREVMYPTTHRQLADEIIEKGGALFSEFELKQKAQEWTFPQRNRLMAGISHATLIIEAGVKSGTMITARRAMEYNRDVAIIPGEIFDPLREGPHSLMRDGAVPITCSDDLLELLGFSRREGQSSLNFKDNNILENLNENERKILGILQIESCNKNTLINRLGMDTKVANIIISSMELEGLIEDIDGRIKIK